MLTFFNNSPSSFLLFLFPVLLIQVHGQVGIENTLKDLPNGNVQRADFYMHTSLFARLPSNEDPNFITEFEGDLIVCTKTKIYRINVQDKSVSLFIDVNQEIKDSVGDDRGIDLGNSVHGGLRSFAFHPKKKRFIYVSMMEIRPSNPSSLKYLTNDPDSKADSVVAEFKLNKDRKSVKKGSYRSVLRIGVPFVPGKNFYDHPIKTIAFRKRLLYIAHGDTADQVASMGGGQNNDAFGKILRINPLKKKSTGQDYTVKGSPFKNDPNMLDEVWALGLRNPHHLCFGNGEELFIGETGRGTVEEVNIAKGGENFGWANREGPFVFAFGSGNGAISDLPSNDASFGYTYPAAAFGHVSGGISQAMGGGCPITNNSPMNNFYLYCDFPVSGQLYYSKVNQMLNAKTKGDPDKLSRAITYQPYLCYHDNGPVVKAESLGEIVKDLDPEYTGSSNRADIRLGRGPGGVMYWSSKTNAAIYVIDSSKSGGDVSPC